jgi:hypothetical protein
MRIELRKPERETGKSPPVMMGDQRFSDGVGIQTSKTDLILLKPSIIVQGAVKNSRASFRSC